jgi:CBS domain-containing membrane protein
MSPVVEILSVGDTIDLAERHMRLGRIRHLPVVDGQQRLVGLITHRKLLAAWLSHGDPAHESHRALAREVPVEMLMETDVVTVGPDTPLATVAALMDSKKIGCVPVVQSGRVVGIITEADFVKLARKMFATPGSG